MSKTIRKLNLKISKRLEKSILKSFDNYDQNYKSKHWARYDLRKILYKTENLPNFRNNFLSSGLDDQSVSTAIIKNNFFKLKKKINIKFIENNLLTKNIGNLKNFIYYKKKILDYGQLFFIYWLHLIKKKIKNINFICEIGGGYGGFAEKIITNYPGAKYLIIDLPEANFLSGYFLSHNFPNKKILLAYERNREKIYKSDFKKYDIIIIPPWFRVEKIKFDLFINTRSMMEMDKEIIFNYFKFIQNNISKKGFFFNANRYFKNTVTNPIKLIDYPYDNNWKTLISRPSWLQRHIRILLTQRVSVHGDISLTIKKLKKINKKYFLKEKIKKKYLLKKFYFWIKNKLYFLYKFSKH